MITNNASIKLVDALPEIIKIAREQAPFQSFIFIELDGERRAVGINQEDWNNWKEFLKSTGGNNPDARATMIIIDSIVTIVDPESGESVVKDAIIAEYRSAEGKIMICKDFYEETEESNRFVSDEPEFAELTDPEQKDLSLLRYFWEGVKEANQ